VQEHLAPLFPEFLNQFNPKDTRFLGTPLDFIVFDGLDEGEVRRVVFVEVKTGKAGLLSRERRCRDAIEAGRVEYQLLRLPTDVIEAGGRGPDRRAVRSRAVVQDAPPVM
jgi:predicted Holliday junction resolvase-like endonuclease